MNNPDAELKQTGHRHTGESGNRLSLQPLNLVRSMQCVSPGMKGNSNGREEVFCTTAFGGNKH